MKTLKRNWAKLAGAVLLAGLAMFTVYACLSVWGQTLPGLSIALMPSNQVSLTVTNGTTNAHYQIYYTEYLNDTNYPWLFWTNGTLGQTNFTADLGGTEMGFFIAVNNTNFAPLTVSVIIQSPANGTVIY